MPWKFGPDTRGGIGASRQEYAPERDVSWRLGPKAIDMLWILDAVPGPERNHRRSVVSLAWPDRVLKRVLVRLDRRQYIDHNGVPSRGWLTPKGRQALKQAGLHRLSLCTERQACESPYC